MYNLLESIFMSKELYQTILEPICNKYNMTFTEMVILLFLANNPEHDTATDIVAKRRLTKSAVSMAVRALQNRGFITGKFADGNHRSIHLKVCESANDIIREGRKTQKAFLQIVTNDFSDSEKESLQNHLTKIIKNINQYHSKIKQFQK